MLPGQQAIILFRQGAQFEAVVGNVVASGPLRNKRAVCIDDFDELMTRLMNRQDLCVVANADENPKLLEMLNDGVSCAGALFPILFFSDDVEKFNARREECIGVYDIIPRMWINEHTLPKFIASCVYEYATFIKPRSSREVASITTRLLALISHEIKVPLDTLRMTQANLLTLEMSDNAKSMATQSERAIAYLCEYVGDFIEHARLEKNDVKSLAEEFCVKTMIQEVIDLVLPKASIKDISINLALPATDIFHAYGDRKRLRQILINILSNAVRYTDEGRVEIIIRAEEELQFEIKDTGVGMTPDRIKEVFHSDVDVIMASNGCSDAGGLGIGIALCRKLVDLLGGKIEAQSVREKGTSVRIFVPYHVIFGGSSGVNRTKQRQKEIKSVA